MWLISAENLLTDLKTIQYFDLLFYLQYVDTTKSSSPPNTESTIGFVVTEVAKTTAPAVITYRIYNACFQIRIISVQHLHISEGTRLFLLLL